MAVTSKARTVAIYGQIGSGKTEVARVFTERGALVLSADAIGREVLAEDAAVRKSLQDEFGSDILDDSGLVNRKLLASRAFESEMRREALDAIVHPPLLERLRNAVREAVNSGEYTVVAVDAALIVRWEMQEEFDFLVCVISPAKLRIERLEAAGFSPEDAVNRIASQIPSDIQADTADFIVENRESLEGLRKRAAEVYANILEADFLD